LDELAGGIATARAGVGPAANRLHRLRPPTGRQERFDDLVEQVDELAFQLRLLEDAAGQEPKVVADGLTLAQQALDSIDAAAAALDEAGCASTSWARAFVDGAMAFIATQLPIANPGTGDFIVDASAACGRFYGTFSASSTGTEVPTDPAEYAAFLDALEGAYEQLVVDLAALTPPVGSEADLAEVVELLELAAKAVDRANRDPSRYAEVERALGAIGSEIGPRVRVLGFPC
jgi:hypothetical protein